MILPHVRIALLILDPRIVAEQPEWHLFTEENLTLIASIFSIISFFLTVFVLYDTRKLRSFYRFRARGPKLLAELRLSRQKINEYLNEFDAFIPQISEELARAAAKLKSLEKKLRRSSRTSVKHLRKRILRCRVNTGSENEVREIYVEMLYVVEELKDYQRDLDWEI